MSEVRRGSGDAMRLPMDTRIVADVDTGIDDACALSWLVGTAYVDLVACSVVSGNTTAESAARNTAAVLDACGATHVPVVVGRAEPLRVPLVTTPETHGPTGLGYAKVPEMPDRISDEDFLAVWARALDDPTPFYYGGQRPPVVLLLTGPLTNLAVALEHDPDLVDRFDRIVIMGGAFGHPGNTTELAEWNTWCDPDAAQRVFAHFAGKPVERLPVVCGLNVTETIEMHPAHLRGYCSSAGVPEPRLRPGEVEEYTAGLPVFELLVNALQFYFQFHLDHEGAYTVHLHDLLAASIAGGAVSFEATPSAIRVGVDGDDRGATLQVEGPASALIVDRVDPGEVFVSWGRALRNLG